MGPEADTSTSAGYPSRPFSKRSDRRQRIRRAQQLRQEGWRQREIADALGVSRSTVSHWLTHSLPGQHSVGTREAKESGAREAEDGPAHSVLEDGARETSDRAVVSGELRGGTTNIGEGE